MRRRISESCGGKRRGLTAKRKDEKPNLCDCYFKVMGEEGDKYERALFPCDNCGGESFILLESENISTLPNKMVELCEVADISGGDVGAMEGQAVVGRGKYLVQYYVTGRRCDGYAKTVLVKNGVEVEDGEAVESETKHAILSVPNRALIALFNKGSCPVTFQKASLLVVKLS